MMTAEELKKNYSSFSTKKLLEIVDNKFDYTELAVTIALAELSTRQVSEQDIKSYKDEQIEKVESFIKRNILDDLTVLQKNLFYFVWFPLINFAFKQNFRDDGYVLKLKQANYYSLIGFVCFMLTGIISGIYELSNWTSFAIWIFGFAPAYAFDETFNRQNQIKRLRKRYAPREAEDGQSSDRENDL
ncbi:hypothetical protein [Pedobacter borealis]|uniref:hypothetical protein n=1 Tax=Pedobacter borealis TaxID=475254 RepID=UPI0012FC6922|nr:hypothetical protein [Pedobacter borealis]